VCLGLHLKMKFLDFKIGQVFERHLAISRGESDKYFAFSKTRNVLLENSELAATEGIIGSFLSGRSILARVEGEMTRLDEFSDNVMMLYGMDGDPSWGYRQTRFLAEVHPGEELLIKYIVSNKSKVDKHGYGILSMDFEICTSSDNRLVIVSRRNLYRMKV
jgi:hypothetical protein